MVVRNIKQTVVVAARKNTGDRQFRGYDITARDMSIRSTIGRRRRRRLRFALKTSVKSKDAHRVACDAPR